MSIKEVNLKIKGLHCSGCVATVKDILESDFEGVKQADVKLEAEQVNLSYDPEISNLKDMENALREAGYTLLI